MARLERIAERLELKEFQLRALLDVTRAINNNVDQPELLQLYGGIMREQLEITRLTLFVHSSQWQCVLTHGTGERPTTIDVDEVFGHFRDIQVIGGEGGDGLAAFDVAVPVFHQDRPLALLLIGDIDEEEQRMSPTIKHLNFIQTLTNIIVVAMENRRLARQELQQERDRREMELAAEMQAMLIPRDLPTNDRINAAGWYQPHRQVGGDHYDLFHTSEHELIFCIADVSGKGMAASLLMSNFQASLRGIAAAPDASLASLVHLLNDRVYSSARGERFITLFIGRVDLRTRRLEFINSGHNAPLLLQQGKITPLHDGSIALGMMPKLPFLKEGLVDLAAGATILCFTDGLVEQENGAGTAFEEEPMKTALLQGADKGPAAVLQKLREDFERHREGLPYLDDIAVLVCTFG